MPHRRPPRRSYRPSAPPKDPHPGQPRPAHRPSRPTAGSGGKDTSWEQSATWYDRLIGEKGSELYRHVVLPGALRLLRPHPGESILDLGCGQGVLARLLADEGALVTAVDAAPSLIQAARRYQADRRHKINFQIRDATDLTGLGPFDAITAILCLQNMPHLAAVANASAAALKPGGRMLWVLNHPAFRIPRQTHWGYDEQTHTQFRRIDAYASPAEIPIIMHPGKADSETTLSFHRSLQDLLRTGFTNGLKLSDLEEWTSHKRSEPGPRARAENKARAEFPLFIGLLWERPTPS